MRKDYYRHGVEVAVYNVRSFIRAHEGQQLDAAQANELRVLARALVRAGAQFEASKEAVVSAC